MKELYNALQALKEHVTRKRFVELQDFLQLLHIVEIVFIQEVLHMGYGETEAYQKGKELGSYFARSFEVKHDPIAHQMLAKFFAYSQGFKDMDTGFSFIQGFTEGIESEPKQITGKIHDAQNEL